MPFDRSARIFKAGVLALGITCLLAACNHAASTPPPPTPAHTAGVALQEANDQFRSDFKEVVSVNATNFGGYPCGTSCWRLTHLEKDDSGVIPNAYDSAIKAYTESTSTPPKELDEWKSAIKTVQADIQVWGDTADETRGVTTHSLGAQNKVLADLDKADALVNAFAPAAVRAAGTAGGG